MVYEDDIVIPEIIGVQNNIPSPSRLGEALRRSLVGEGWGEGNAGKCTPSSLSSPGGEDEVSSIDNLKMVLCYQ